ncbi:germ cell-less protein-like 1 [Pteropus alecto]|uniref:Germ cell-less protein-like 1 n=1 Tax=Pteropus alecto TaxID=9402 RepID=L5L4T9_PTEAL|nr:germ cell-less protein-like 1 [Pteropus alecto]ELK18053.1 Germ cell-less protein-like 1 [Pteropus alecto]
MGALSSRVLWLWGRCAPQQQGAIGIEEEEVVEAAMATADEVEESIQAGPTTSQGGLKRKTGSGEPHEKEPHRKRAKDNSGSNYEALFMRGEGSDVQICALGEAWNLHRVYLCQSGYFASMFSGAWKEATMNTIELQMPDENIDCEALHKALSSLYQDSVFIPPNRVICLLAAASMLQLDELIQQCGEVMKETVSAQTVCSYYYSAESYGLPNIRTMCFQWLLDNLMTQRSEHLLREVSLDLMKELIASSELLVMEVEMDVYTKLKKWLFLQLQPTWSGPHRALLSDANLWFARSKRESEDTPFLETEEGRAFVPVFQQLRLAYIICDLHSARTIDRDALIPAAWLAPVYKEQWLALLRAEQTRNLGPIDVNMSDLQENSMRCGGQLRRDEKCSWRWAGFNFGWDLVVCYTNRRIIFRRSVLNKPCGLGVSLPWQRKIVFRLRLASLDRAGRAVFRKDTEYQVISLRKHQELEVVNLENQDVVFPIYVACNFLYLPREGHCPE